MNIARQLDHSTAPPLLSASDAASGTGTLGSIVRVKDERGPIGNKRTRPPFAMDDALNGIMEIVREGKRPNAASKLADRRTEISEESAAFKNAMENWDKFKNLEENVYKVFAVKFGRLLSPEIRAELPSGLRHAVEKNGECIVRVRGKRSEREVQL